MRVAARDAVRDDGLSHTTLRLGSGLPASSIAEVVRVLQRVPGVLTVDRDAENAQAFVAHDAAVPIASLVAAANRAGAAAKVVVFPSATAALAESGVSAPHRLPQSPLMAVVGLAAMLAVVFIDIALPNSSDKRWFFIVPVILLWVFMLLRATRARRSTSTSQPRERNRL